MDIIPVEEKNSWISELRPILTEMDKLSNADKIEEFKNEVVAKYVATKAVGYMSQQLALADCDIELLENKIEELSYKVDNLGVIDENRLKAYIKMVTVPSTDQEVRERNIKMFKRNQARMKMLNDKIDAL